MSYKVLVVDDEPQIHTFIRISLAAEGFEYIGADSVAEGVEMFKSYAPHLVVLDLGLPDGDGINLLSIIRQTSKTPVLILTARDQEDEKIRLLEAGANDYLSKPFGVRELIVRIKVLVRDLISDTNLDDMQCFGALKMKKSTNQVWLSALEIELTRKEFAFMGMLMKHPGRLVKQSDLLQQIWGNTHTDDTHYLRVLVSHLRKKLNDGADEQQVIKTEAGVGYRLVFMGAKV
jgi:two-component system KDP operon response regulator KdpE